MFPLHWNLMLGPFGSVVVFLSGLLLPLSFVTGLLLWLESQAYRVTHAGRPLLCPRLDRPRQPCTLIIVPPSAALGSICQYYSWPAR